MTFTILQRSMYETLWSIFGASFSILRAEFFPILHTEIELSDMMRAYAHTLTMGKRKKIS